MTACNNRARFAENNARWLYFEYMREYVYIRLRVVWERNKIRSICLNFALVLGILIWDMLDCSGCNFQYFVWSRVWFGVVEYVYICLFIVYNFSILGEAKILIWPWVQLWLFVFFFRVHRQLVVGLAYACRPKDQSVLSAKCALGSIIALLSNIWSRWSETDAMLIKLVERKQMWIS